MKRSTVRLIALVTVIIFFVTSVGLMSISIFFGR